MVNEGLTIKENAKMIQTGSVPYKTSCAYHRYIEEGTYIYGARVTSSASESRGKLHRGGDI